MGTKSLNHKHTLAASYIGYIVQAIVNNFAPLLFVTFQVTYGITIGKITLLIAINFGVQLIVDFLFSRIADKVGLRKCVLFAHALVFIGLMCLVILPDLMGGYAYWGLVISVVIYAVGGGLLEVVVSPIVEACPTNKKSALMSMLHSFYCWGAAIVILISTICFWTFGVDCWRYLAICWALIPIANCVYFCFVPIYKFESDECESTKVNIYKSRNFWLIVIVMLCAGAAEQIIAQWASTIAEVGLNVSKEVGDLTGPFSFAILMGVSRVLYAVFSSKISLKLCMIVSGIMCVGSYLLAALSPIPVLSLIGCALAGFSVGLLWPGAYSLATQKVCTGNTSMFAMLALAGDVGCTLGPTLTGLITEHFGGNFSAGLLVGLIFPILLIFALIPLKKKTAQISLDSSL